MPRGGARVGAGRPKKTRDTAWLTGKRGSSGPRPVDGPKAAEAFPEAVKRPQGLSDEDKAVWDELAPLAVELGTLTPATTMAFADLCAYIVLERKLRAAPLAVAGPDHRGMMARVEVARARFRLTGDGKLVAQAEAPKDEFAEFDTPLKLVKKA